MKEAIDALEAEKKNLMAELASSVTGFSEAKKQMVDSVSNVLEDEFQCAICNELFITVSIKSSFILIDEIFQIFVGILSHMIFCCTLKSCKIPIIP